MAKKKSKTDIEQSMKGLMALGLSEMFNIDPAELNPQQRTEAWATIDAMGAVFLARKEELRESLLEIVQEVGDETEAGHFVANIEGNEVKRERRQGKSPEDKAFRELLKSLSIPLTDCYTEETKYTLDPSKVQYLIDGGRLPEDKVHELKKVTFALRVKANSDLRAELDRVSERFKKLKTKKQLKK
jgi:hypothetical protein